MNDIEPLKIKLSKQTSLKKAITGGCINQCFLVDFDDGSRIFLKSNEAVDDDFFEKEVLGLKTLEKQVEDITPKILGWDRKKLILEFLAPIPFDKNAWRTLGRKIAELHALENSNFGLSYNNYCGSSLQNNDHHINGIIFFVTQRLRPLIRHAIERKLLSLKRSSGIELLLEKLPTLIPEQKAVLIHGDLWHGNVMNSSKGVKIFDPAIYFGWAESELAMTRLFGGFDDAFYQGYVENSSLDTEWESRMDLYHLYPLLNHLCLFGESYLSPILNIVKRYV